MLAELSSFEASLGVVLGLSGLIVTGAGLYGIARLVTLPSRRRAHGRQFIQLLELAVADGRSPESVLVDAAATNDPCLPAQIHLIAAYAENGVSLDGALSLVSGLLPTDVSGMIQTGLRSRRLDRVLKPASLALAETDSRGKAGLGAVFVNLVLSTSLTAWFGLWISLGIVPRFVAMMEDLLPASHPSPPAVTWILGHLPWLLSGLATLVPLSLFLLFARNLNPALRLPGLDLVRLLLPWHRQRAHRNFAALLGLQLDAGATEEDAVREAAAATGNRWIQSRAHRAAIELRRGTPLDVAVAKIDSRPEFGWRIRNALASPGLASDALRGWVLDLHSRADRTEYITGQAIAVSVFAIQSALVGAYMCGLFFHLILLIEAATNQ